MDFRQATIADEPAFGFRRIHRAGRQVREYRLFTGMMDMDKKILEREEEISGKRSLGGGDDEQPKAKRARVADDRMAPIDLLEKMANNDKKILVKQDGDDEQPKAKRA